MRHLSQQMVAVEIRRPHLNRYRRILRESLQNPGLSGSERAVVRQKLNNAGKPKVYDAKAPAPPGAIDPGPMPQPPIEVDTSTRETLAAETHTRLFLFAMQNSLEVQPKHTKAQVIEIILSHKQGETE